MVDELVVVDAVVVENGAVVVVVVIAEEVFVVGLVVTVFVEPELSPAAPVGIKLIICIPAVLTASLTFLATP